MSTPNPFNYLPFMLAVREGDLSKAIDEIRQYSPFDKAQLPFNELYHYIRALILQGHENAYEFIDLMINEVLDEIWFAKKKIPDIRNYPSPAHFFQYLAKPDKKSANKEKLTPIIQHMIQHHAKALIETCHEYNNPFLSLAGCQARSFEVDVENSFQSLIGLLHEQCAHEEILIFELATPWFLFDENDLYTVDPYKEWRSRGLDQPIKALAKYLPTISLEINEYETASFTISTLWPQRTGQIPIFQNHQQLLFKIEANGETYFSFYPAASAVAQAWLDTTYTIASDKNDAKEYIARETLVKDIPRPATALLSPSPIFPSTIAQWLDSYGIYPPFTMADIVATKEDLISAAATPAQALMSKIREEIDAWLRPGGPDDPQVNLLIDFLQRLEGKLQSSDAEPRLDTSEILSILQQILDKNDKPIAELLLAIVKDWYEEHHAHRQYVDFKTALNMQLSKSDERSKDISSIAFILGKCIANNAYDPRDPQLDEPELEGPLDELGSAGPVQEDAPQIMPPIEEGPEYEDDDESDEEDEEAEKRHLLRGFQRT